ncbi:hypothetical protein CTAYLR_010462 [Chrysophaeum taylorii]|uniref:Uncharacterized protein n=1 Tax=Chrysophaeum taylorii TaxID=2483200 RepID=A0AAD7XF16_9STRA|nr:hypothetical protein CTAYLR_010462 [Chrysophaeum taylorii]
MSKIAPARSAYALFTSDCHARFRREANGQTLSERMRRISEGWRTLSADEKATYEKRASEDRGRFERESAARDAEALEEQAARRAAAIPEEVVEEEEEEAEEEEEEEDDDDDDDFEPVLRKRGRKRSVAPKRASSEERYEKKKKMKKKKARAEAREKRDANVARERDELHERAAASASARLQYLLAQSDIFSHFGVARDAKPAAGKKERSGASIGQSPSKRRARQETGSSSSNGEDEDAGGPPVLLAQPPTISGGKLRGYQLEGLNWMIRLDHYGVNGILADEMGLGKTLQCISMLAWLAEAKEIRGPHLVLAPKSTLGNWIGEFQRWCPEALRAVRFHGTKAERKEFVEDVLKPGVPSERREWDVVVATYEVANAEKVHLEKISWRFVVIDEAHRIKNEASVFARTARALRSDRRLLVTGTPLQNNLHELWALLNFLLPDVFASSEQFDEWFNLDVDDVDDKKRIIGQLHKLLRPFVLRRLKSDVEKSLPPKTETILFTGLSTLQKDLYRSLLKREATLLLGGGGGGGGGLGGDGESSASRTAISNIAMQLRKCCNHPYLFKGVEDRTLDPMGEHVVENCGKLKLLDKLLVKLKSRGHRVLVFSQMTQLLDILEDMMHMRRYQYCRIDGNTSYDDRDELIEAYNAPDSTKFVFLLSTRAGGLGINLQTADTCVLYDSDWNPQADLQAMDRCHRIGQTKPVNVYRLVTGNTIEEKVVERAHKKLKLDAMVVQQGRLAGGKSATTQGPSKEEMLEAVKFGASAIFRSDESEVTDEDIEHILDRGRAKTKVLMDKLQDAHLGEDMLDFRLDGDTTVQEFEGVDYSKEENRAAAAAAAADEALAQALIADMENDKRERSRTAATYNVTLLSNGGVDRAQAKRNPVPVARRLPKLEDWQFYDQARLREIGKIEEDAYAALEAAGDAVALEAAREAGVLDPAVEAEKAELLAAGFQQWTKARFRDWVREVSRRGRDNHAAVADALVALGHLDVDEARVKRYAETFWARAETTFQPADWDKALKTIKKGEKAMEQNAAARASLRKFLDSYGSREVALDRAIVDANAAALNVDDLERPFARAEDRWLLCAADDQGDADPDGDDLLAAVYQQTDRFLFDYFMLSREPKDLASRASFLARKADDFMALEEKARAAKRARDDDVSPDNARTLDQIQADLLRNDAEWAAASVADAIAAHDFDEKKKAKAKLGAQVKTLGGVPRTSTGPHRASSHPASRAVIKLPATPFLAYVSEKASDLVKQHNDRDPLVDRDLSEVSDEILIDLEQAWYAESDDIKRAYEAKCRPPATTDLHSSPKTALPKRDPLPLKKKRDSLAPAKPSSRRDVFPDDNNNYHAAAAAAAAAAAEEPPLRNEPPNGPSVPKHPKRPHPMVDVADHTPAEDRADAPPIHHHQHPDEATTTSPSASPRVPKKKLKRVPS